jgi:agmatinase
MFMLRGMSFDPSISISSEFGIFGIPVTEAEAKLVLLPVPWEVTTSYGVGASNGPRIIRQASEQVDLYDFETGKVYEKGIFMRPESAELHTQNKAFKEKAQELIELVSSQSQDTGKMENLRRDVNSACKQMSDWVYQQSKDILKQGKTLGLVGGDHSTPYGAIRAVSEMVNGDFGILHIDAHADLREQYQGFHQSHASIMHNVMTSEFRPKKLVQVGIRDFCEEEFIFSKAPENRIKTHFDIALKQRQLAGESWAALAKEVISDLPKNVYVSFDIDGLDPALCPSTGTPVPGGLSLNEAFYLFKEIHQSGRRIIAFDLNEVSTGPNDEAEWDGNVGARVLYKLCGWALT